MTEPREPARCKWCTDCTLRRRVEELEARADRMAIAHNRRIGDLETARRRSDEDDANFKHSWRAPSEAQGDDDD